MADGNPILELLLQGGQPDPTGAFMANAFLQGRLGGDPTVNLHTVLSMLSPGAVAERRSAEPGMTELLGLEEEEGEQLMQQMLGLTLSPMQQMTQQTATNQMMLDFFKQEQEAGFKERDVGVKEADLGIKRKAETRRGKVAESTIKQLDATAQALTELAESRRITRELKQMLLQGVDPQGQPLTSEEQQVMYAVAGLRQADPSQLQLIRAMLNSGVQADREFAAQRLGELLGVDTTAIAQAPTFFQRLLKRFDPTLGPPPTIGNFQPETGGEVSDEDLEKLIQRGNQFRESLKEQFEREQ